MIELAKSDVCTGCGACAFKCPSHCISIQEDRYGTVLPVIDETSCIECHACEKVCPILDLPSLYSSTAAYAAWSTDPSERKTSASGGIAIEMYRYAIRQGFKAVGASQNEDFSVTLKIVPSIQELPPFKNSKYVFCNTREVFPEIREELNTGQKIIFIGLPCQVAAIRKLFQDNENLLLVDIVCHGATPFLYLKQHIDMISRQKGKTASRMSFRDPAFATCTYTFTLYDESNRCFYAKRTKDGDTYQFGYHRAVSYRENCFHCRFARPERVGDITLADYPGLGLSAPFPYSKENISMVLVNTEKGMDFMKQMAGQKHIFMLQRPLEEPFKRNSLLRSPSPKTKYRREFERGITTHQGNFEAAIASPLSHYTQDMKIRKLFSFPLRVARKMKNILLR